MNTAEITELAATWCRMWNQDSALAHQLMTDDCVQWFADGPDLDSVVGPAQQEAFVTAARARLGNIFVPRLYVIDGDTFAYLWDVRSADATVMTGIDVNVQHGRRIKENWTFAGPHRDEPDPPPGDLLERDVLAAEASKWAQAKGYAVHRQLIVDVASGRVAMLRTTSAGIGGVDILTVRDGVVDPIWSVTGTRAFRY
ncbi:hypothetical protein ACN27E_04850 [Mycobacterium sp. WMMD1722]|uniref:hypothetical protein n=1 Tax=Mycobacterium sp. WMMD1722 TaxID=3404117 RepID=UPI003BF4AA83